MAERSAGLEGSHAQCPGIMRGRPPMIYTSDAGHIWLFDRGPTLTADLAHTAWVQQTLGLAYAKACELIQDRVDAVQADAIAPIERHVLDGRHTETIVREHVPRITTEP